MAAIFINDKDHARTNLKKTRSRSILRLPLQIKFESFIGLLLGIFN